ncbi:hypothetical protein Q4R10_13570 [Morganella morganii]
MKDDADLNKKIESIANDFFEKNKDIFIPEEIDEIISIVKTETDIHLMKAKIAILMFQFHKKAVERFIKQE